MILLKNLLIKTILIVSAIILISIFFIGIITEIVLTLKFNLIVDFSKAKISNVIVHSMDFICDFLKIEFQYNI